MMSPIPAVEPMVDPITAPVVAPFDTISPVIETIFDPIAAPVQTRIDSVAFLVQVPLDPIAAPVQAARQPGIASGPRFCRPTVETVVDSLALGVEPRIDPIAFGVEPIVDAISSTIETFVETITSRIEPAVDAVAEPVEKTICREERRRDADRQCRDADHYGSLHLSNSFSGYMPCNRWTLAPRRWFTSLFLPSSRFYGNKRSWASRNQSTGANCLTGKAI